MPKSKLTAHDLAHFHGSETVYAHGVSRGFTYTEGVRHLAREGGAYWLIDAVFSHQLNPRVRAEPFQVWTLTVDNGRAVLTCTDGNDTPPLVTQQIEFTDFPLGVIEMYLEAGVLMLPSER